MMAVFCIILGIIMFLLMEHALVFWLVFMPLAVIFFVCLHQFFTKGSIGIGYGATALCVLLVSVVALVIVCIP